MLNSSMFSLTSPILHIKIWSFLIVKEKAKSQITNLTAAEVLFDLEGPQYIWLLTILILPCCWVILIYSLPPDQIPSMTKGIIKSFRTDMELLKTHILGRIQITQWPMKCFTGFCNQLLLFVCNDECYFLVLFSTLGNYILYEWYQ